MRGAGITSIGGPVEILDLDSPRAIAATDVVIDVHAAGVGNWDDLVRTGSWRVGGPPPNALGVEAAGRIAAVGDGVTAFAAGDEVLTHPLPLKRNGTWAEHLIAPAAAVARKPSALTYAAASAFPVPALTAIQALDEALLLERGDWLLVNGAGGVTGGMLVQLGVARGASVVATASKANSSRLLAWGAKEVLDYHDENWPRLVREITGGDGVTKAANAARGGAAKALQAVAAGGRLATITSDPPHPERDVTIASVYVRPDGPQLEVLAERLGSGELTLEIASVHPLDDAASALAAAVAGHAGGAIVISLSE